MTKFLNKIERCEENDYRTLVEIWERSVRATHTFLGEDDIAEIREALIPLYFPGVDLYCVFDGGTIAGLMGLAGNKIEMLFIDDCRRGHGFGTQLVNHAKIMGAVAVDVNEQNPSALEFYKANGFKIIGRDEYDEGGRHFPILHLSLMAE